MCKSKKKIFKDAIKHNNINKVEKILKLWEDNNIYIDKETILLDACVEGHIKIFKFLLNHFVNNNYDVKTIVEHVGITYIESYTSRLDVDIVNCLLKYCIEYNIYIFSDEVIFKLISRDDLIYNLLEYRLKIKKPFDISKYEHYIYCEILCIASTQTIKLLFDYGEKINYKLNAYQFRWHREDVIKYVKYLIKHNYSIDIKYIDEYIRNRNLIKFICITKTIFINRFYFECIRNHFIEECNGFNKLNYILCITDFDTIVKSRINCIYNNNYITYSISD